MPNLSYHESIAYLEALNRDPIVPAAQVGLERARTLLTLLDNPERSFRAVHVTGSCGKGSTTSMIASILQASGFRTGCLRSPHLEDYTERVAVDALDISREEWASYFNLVLPAVERLRSGNLPGYHLGRPSFSEIIFSLACLYFMERGVEWAAIETGLGGRLDATNVLASDASVITNVSLEHTQLLGESIELIAAEKAAIIKRRGVALTGSTDPEALEVIARQARSVDSPLIVLDADIQYEVLAQTLTSQQLTVRAPNRNVEIELSVGGGFQATNAALAVGVAWALQDREVPVTDSAIMEGLKATKIPGRFEVVEANPLVILDGAHNAAESHALRQAIDDVLDRRELVLLFAAMSDKALGEMAKGLASGASRVFLTLNPNTERAASLAELSSAFRPVCADVVEIEDYSRALEAARAASYGKVLVACGSLYLVGALRHQILSRLAVV